MDCTETTRWRLGACEVCRDNEAKYTCPACHVKTCCLVCVNIHKKELECTGQRNRVQFKQLQHFTDMDLHSDYCLLEEIGRSVDRVSKTRRLYQKNMQLKWLKLKTHMWKRGTRLDLLPPQFFKHESNTSYLNWTTGVVSWKLELIFPQADNLTIQLNRVDETNVISEVLQVYLQKDRLAEISDKSSKDKKTDAELSDNQTDLAARLKMGVQEDLELADRQMDIEDRLGNDRLTDVELSDKQNELSNKQTDLEVRLNEDKQSNIKMTDKLDNNGQTDLELPDKQDKLTNKQTELDDRHKLTDAEHTRLRPYHEGDIKVLMRVEKTNNDYLVVNTSLSLGEWLEGKHIVEHPTFYIILSSHLHVYNIVSPESVKLNLFESGRRNSRNKFSGKPHRRGGHRGRGGFRGRGGRPNGSMKFFSDNMSDSDGNE